MTLLPTSSAIVDSSVLAEGEIYVRVINTSAMAITCRVTAVTGKGGSDENKGGVGALIHSGGGAEMFHFKINKNLPDSCPTTRWEVHFTFKDGRSAWARWNPFDEEETPAVTAMMDILK
jgi:hypothetical protein